MNIESIISRVDSLMPNQYTNEDKIAWLSTLDGKIYLDIITTHWSPERIDEFHPYESITDELIVPSPWGEDIYCGYLKAMIAANNAETARYAVEQTFFESAYKQWTDYYNRTHHPFPVWQNRVRW